MKIIIDATTTQDQFAYAGVGQYTKNIITQLVKKHPEDTFYILLFKDKESTLEDILEQDNLEVVDIGKFRVNGYLNDITYLFQILPQILKYKDKETIFFSPYFGRNFPSYIMPTVLFVHDMNLPIFNMYSQKSKLHNFIRKIQYWLTLNKCMKCKYILCNSETTKKDFLKYYNYNEERVVVSYLGVDLDENNVEINSILDDEIVRKGYLIYLGGGINKTKNSIGVIKSYYEFLQKFKSPKEAPYLVIAGGKFQKKELPEVQELYSEIKKKGIESKVVFTGFYEDEHKFSLLNNAFAFIHLSLYEGFGFSPIEALRSKVPVVLHKNPVYKELFSDVAIMVDGNEYIEVGNKLFDIYTNPEKYIHQVEKGYELSMKYSWEEVSEVTYEVLSKT